jgi:DNA-3-methyladenine glycosylase I
VRRFCNGKQLAAEAAALQIKGRDLICVSSVLIRGKGFLRSWHLVVDWSIYYLDMSDKLRCPWGTTPAMIAYHDDEWGVPQHDDRVLFEFLILEGAQAGLSWSTILAKREAYQKAFSAFDPAKVARFNAEKIKRLMSDPGIVRNRLKIDSAIRNAQAALAVQKEFGSFDRYLWEFVGGVPIKNSWRSMKNLPAETKESIAMSKDLKRRGFNFVGPTVCYAFMQAVGMVNDHLVDCFRYREVGRNR